MGHHITVNTRKVKYNIILKIYFRTDNGVKNYLYSKLRKGLRRLNKIIHEQFKK